MKEEKESILFDVTSDIVKLAALPIIAGAVYYYSFLTEININFIGIISTSDFVSIGARSLGILIVPILLIVLGVSDTLLKNNGQSRLSLIALGLWSLFLIIPNVVDIVDIYYFSKFEPDIEERLQAQLSDKDSIRLIALIAGWLFIFCIFISFMIKVYFEYRWLFISYVYISIIALSYMSGKMEYYSSKNSSYFMGTICEESECKPARIVAVTSGFLITLQDENYRAVRMDGLKSFSLTSR